VEDIKNQATFDCTLNSLGKHFAEEEKMENVKLEHSLQNIKMIHS